MSDPSQEAVELLDAWDEAEGGVLDAGYITTNEARARLAVSIEAALRAVRESLEDRIREDNAVCLCGCQPGDHESYGEDGESCRNETHTCLRVAVGVLEAHRAALRAVERRTLERAAKIIEGFPNMDAARRRALRPALNLNDGRDQFRWYAAVIRAEIASLSLPREGAKGGP